ncbi:hypothetical protein VE00_02130 [Pseudogymnoascus sp. WSF 3629]|nr:hypothetical protein VE00_02130 [Pseudogymnoascus sp. WSF 3629]
MGSNSEPTFNVLADTRPEDTTLPPFMASTSRGFLPRADPVVDLPEEFAVLSSILDRMPMVTLSGEPGLLAKGALGDTVKAELTDLSAAVEKYADNLCIQTALYRDYSFIASAYLLEPCHMAYMAKSPYGLGRQTLPRSIALPLSVCARLAGFQPFMEYAGSYALYNYKLENPDVGMKYTNLRLIRAFEKGLDPTSSEAGFVLTHVEMVKNSGPLVEGCVRALDGCGRDDRHEMDDGLDQAFEAIKKVNQVMERMWANSKPGDYIDFRTFIMGITSQSMFPNGVIYEGVSKTPLSFRGESGANDSMIPLLDNLLSISMPSTPLTTILKDFRSYRPGNHRDFLSHIANLSLSVSFKSYALSESSSALRYLRLLDQVRDFRYRHWCFTREYILKKTAHPTATGGSPIVTWLPNQLVAVLDAMTEAGEGKALKSVAASSKTGEEVKEMLDTAERQRDGLKKEVEKWCSDRGVPPPQGIKDTLQAVAAH